ncbi:low-affinity glucose transporter Hxt3p [[Candida] railenensis]|uniref:Quinate transporter n=1 Tax=[Candida] railenensis TaxID=45579 RepID=A0A9P0QQH9_9ASCO|nr:low-affinity glucose transporter Hxt3p [[Candida] railenensis]
MVFEKLRKKDSHADVEIRKSIEAEQKRVLSEVPDEIYNWKLVMCAITAAAAAVIIGYDAGFIGGTIALTSFQDEFGFDKMSTSEVTLISSNVVSVFQAGAFFGSLIMYPVGEILGRKVGLIISGFLLTIGAAISLISKSSNGLGAIYAGRVLTGVGIGGCSGLAPIYVSEIAPTEIRGRLVGCWEVSWQVGGIIGYWINYGVLQNLPATRKQWLIPFAIQLVPSGLFWGGSFLIPESPRFLISKDKIDRARSNLSYLSNLPEDHPYLVQELEKIQIDINDKRRKLGTGFFAPLKKVLTTRKLLYRMALSTSLFPMQNGSGINAITYYSPTVFKSLGVSGTNATLQSTGIFGLLKGFASVVWIFFIVDNFGRRTALIWGSIPCSLCMWYIGAYIKVADPAAKLANGDTKMDAGGKAAQAMLYIWTICYGASWNGTPWCINSEIFTQDIRTFTQAINSSSNWFWAFIWGRFTGNAFNKMGYGIYFLFASCMCVFPVVVYFLYPETKGVPLEAIDHLFEVPAWRGRQYALEQYSVEYEKRELQHNTNESTASEVEVKTENE